MKTQSDYSQQEQYHTSTLKYHILQIDSGSPQTASISKLTTLLLVATVSCFF